MQLSEQTDKALKGFLGVDTWASGHPLDWDRWYDFVNQYQREYGCGVDDGALREYMVKKVGCKRDSDLERIIIKHIGVMCRILDFLKRTAR